MSTRILSLCLCAASALALGCSDPGVPGEPDGGATPDGMAGPIGGDRPVEVYVPESYQDGTPAPLVVLLHGYTATGAAQEFYFQFEPHADQRGFIYAKPDGLADDIGNQYWNATEACCDFDGSGVDDSAYLRRVIDDLEAAFTIDDRRVFLVGHSNGGFMSHRMACDHADAIAAIASLAGAMHDDVALCQPSEPVAALQIHGTFDATIRYNGGDLFGVPYPSAAETVADWAALDGCDAVETPGPSLDLVSSVGGAETDVARFETNCTPGGHAELWTMNGAGHLPPLTDDFAIAVFDFLFAHAKQ